MKRNILKVLCVLMSVIMLSSAFAAFGHAEDVKKNDVPVIFVDGLNANDIINTKTGETLFPPQADVITSAVAKAALPVVGSLAGKNYEKAAKAASEAVKAIFGPVACDINGDPAPYTTVNYERPTEEEILEKYTKETGYTATDAIYYCYDWRLDARTLASQLHDFIEYTLDATGAEKVNIIGFSQGTCVVMTYLHDYDYEHINNVVLLGGGFNGVSVCGEPFAGKVDFDDEATVRFIYSMLGNDAGSLFIKAVVDVVYQMGLIESVADFSKTLSDKLMPYVFEEAFPETFGLIPGYWMLIPYDIYDTAKSLCIGDNATSAYIEKIDYYHNEIQPNNKAIIDGARAEGINVSIVAKYGYTIPPVVESINEPGDAVIDTKYESMGATCCTTDTVFADDYIQAVNDSHDHISADRIIDASTCAYPENTWFLKGLQHATHNDSEWELCDFLLNSEKQPTVWDNENYPQYLTLVNDKFVPMTSENAYNAYAETQPKQQSFIAKIIHIFKLIIKAFKAIIGK